MNDTSKGAPINSGASEPHAAVAARRTREPVARRIYVAMRLEDVGVEIAEKAKERERLTSDLNAAPSIDGPTPKQLRQRRAYVADRIDMLRKEQAELNSEKRAMGPAGGPEDGAGSSDDVPGRKKTIFN